MSEVREQALPPGTRLDSFEIRDVLGIGGFGITYRARDHHLACDVAIKEYFPSSVARRGADGATLSPHSDEGREGLQKGLSRFLDEARTLARFREPSIVRVSRFLEANGTGYLVMDLEAGEPLAKLIGRHGPIDEASARRLLPAVLRGLEVVHGAGILHRDIKPANLMVRPSGDPVLLDFGAAREAVQSTTQPLTALLTPGYAPIEQYGGGERQGPWTDLYALGATFYHAIVGLPPHDVGERLARDADGLPDGIAQGLRSAHGRIEPPILKVVYWLMRPHAKDRPRDAARVLGALRKLGVVGPEGATTRATAPHAAPGATPARIAPTLDPEATRAPCVALGAEESARIEALLAEHLGPIAGLLVERASAEARDAGELHSRLAAEIDDPDERARFLAAAARPA